jgi:hypothetical protein
MYSDLNDYRKSYKTYRGKYPDIPDSYYNYLNNIDLDDTTLLQIDEYRYFLTSYIKMLEERQSSYCNGLEETSHLLDLIEKSFNSQIIME